MVQVTPTALLAYYFGVVIGNFQLAIKVSCDSELGV